MPSFCRHNRLESTCPVCAREQRRAGAESKPARPAARTKTRTAGRTTSPGSKRRRVADGVVVRRLARAEDDGFTCELAAGLRARSDALLLADELAFAAARLAELGSGAPGLLGEAARLSAAGRREDALWLVAQVAAIGPAEAGADGERPDPFAAIAAAAVPWTADELPDVPAGLRGPRASSDVTATLRSYRAWAARGGGQAAALAGEASWSPARRFERAFERLALPGFGRGARFDFLLMAGALGLADVRPASLQLLADQRDPVLAAAKRVFAFGDPIVLERRSSELASAAALPLGALDLGLLNWARRADDPAAARFTAGSRAEPDGDVRALVIAALGAGDAGDDVRVGDGADAAGGPDGPAPVN